MKPSARTYAAISGIAAIAVFSITFLCGAIAEPSFDPSRDYVSTLGSRENGLGLVWSVPAFGITGCLLAIFGWRFGDLLQDRWIGVFLIVAGFGFSLAAVPVDLTDAEATTSKIHIVAVCISLAGWCFAMARIGTAKRATEKLRKVANYTVAASICTIILHASGLLSEPILHRLLLVIILGWVGWNCGGLVLSGDPKSQLSTDDEAPS